MQTLVNKVSRQSRAKKMRLLMPLIQRARSILDVGSGWGDFLYDDLPHDWSGTIVAIDKRQRYLDMLKRRFPFVEARVEDATALPFRDGEFDLVVCNAVLEHVPEIAPAIASEIRRVGKHHFAAVPYRLSIVESHYRLPFIGFLPPKQLDWFISRVLRRELHNDPIHLLTRRQMSRLFPGSDIFLIHAALGLFSSVVAIK